MGDVGGRLVLIVEENLNQANAMLKVLYEAGFSPMVAPGIREAVFKLKNHKYSCIIVDLLLGGKNGGELIDLIRTRKDNPNNATPIFVIGTNINKEIMQGLAGKIQGAMLKPLDMAAFSMQIQKLAR